MTPTIHSPLALLFAKIKAEMVANGTPFADAAAEIAFRTWLQAAWLDSGCTQELACLYLPSTGTTLSIIIGHGSQSQISVWWGDGSSQSYGPGQETVDKTYAVAARYPIVILGKLTIFTAEGQAVGGRVWAHLKSLVSFDVLGSANLQTSTDTLPRTLTIFYSNSVSGDVASTPPGIQIFYATSNNLFGDIANIPSGVKQIICSGNITYGTRAWSEIHGITLTPSSAGVFTSAMTDRLIIDTSTATWSGGKILDLRGNCGAPTAAADDAISLLLDKGVNVQTN